MNCTAKLRAKFTKEVANLHKITSRCVSLVEGDVEIFLGEYFNTNIPYFEIVTKHKKKSNKETLYMDKKYYKWYLDIVTKVRAREEEVRIKGICADLTKRGII